MKTIITTKYGHRYTIDDCGCVLEYTGNGGKWDHPHSSWKITGIAEVLPFGHLRRHPLSKLKEMASKKESFTFKNRKPRFTLTDLDHGTHRIHGNIEWHGISSAYTE